MADIFIKNDIVKLLDKKSVVFLGDSNTRAIYKDFLCLLKHSKLIQESVLKAKMENTVFGDDLVYHGEKTNGRDYREERRIKIKDTKIEFYFITRVFNNYVKRIINNINKDKSPDVIIMNSCLWDMCRWGPNGVKEYKENLEILMNHVKKTVSDNCLFIWFTTPPISQEMKGGFLLKQLEFLKYSLRFHVMEANKYARKVVVDNGYDVVDVHYHLKSQIKLRAQDGIHWLPPAVRYVTNLLLTHISLAWGIALPHRFEDLNFIQSLDHVSDEENETEAIKDNTITRKISENDADKSDAHPEKRNQENNNSTITPKKRRRKPNSKTISKKQSHHAFFQRERMVERKKRIASWQSAPDPNSNSRHYPIIPPHSPISDPYSPTTSPYNFTSPYASPYSPITSKYSSCYAANNAWNQKYQSSFEPQFSYTDIAIARHLIQNYSQQFSSQNSPISHLQNSRQHRRPLLPQLYSPEAPQVPLPDWASNRSIPYGTYF